MSDEHYPSGRFGGDMDRNEVEMDLNKFMAMVQEIGELKDKIRDLEDVTKANPLPKDYLCRTGSRQLENISQSIFVYLYVFTLLHNLLVYGFS